MRSDIGMQLKREMLIKLAKRDTDLYPTDAEKRDQIYNRYKSYAIPVREYDTLYSTLLFNHKRILSRNDFNE